jgi:hypothetical protein
MNLVKSKDVRHSARFSRSFPHLQAPWIGISTYTDFNAFLSKIILEAKELLGAEGVIGKNF